MDETVHHAYIHFMHTMWNALYIYWFWKSSVLLTYYIEAYTFIHIHIHGEHSASLYSFTIQEFSHQKFPVTRTTKANRKTLHESCKVSHTLLS